MRMFWLPLSGIGGQASDDIVQRIHISHQPTIHSQSTLTVEYPFEGVCMSLRNCHTFAWSVPSKNVPHIKRTPISTSISVYSKQQPYNAVNTNIFSSRYLKPISMSSRVSEKLAGESKFIRFPNPGTLGIPD